MSTESLSERPPVADLSYEDARDELVAIVARIEGGNASLEESMQLWERGEALAAHCQAKLDQAQEQLDRGANTDRPAEDADTAGEDADTAGQDADTVGQDAESAEDQGTDDDD